jgi:hypothetical protein
MLYQKYKFLFLKYQKLGIFDVLDEINFDNSKKIYIKKIIQYFEANQDNDSF